MVKSPRKAFGKGMQNLGGDRANHLSNWSKGSDMIAAIAVPTLISFAAATVHN